MKNSPKTRSIQEQIESFPALPVTVTRVMEITADPESTANDLVKAILPDQSMCVAILKMANSALYGRSKKISSVESAIVVLGFDEVQNIVLGKAAVSTFQPLFKDRKSELNQFWEHSFTCGLAAKNIGEHINLSTGQLFIGGLLHDIGKLAMLLAFGEDYDISKYLAGFTDTDRLQSEKSQFSTTHDMLGSQLLEHWLFPDTLVTALCYHHSPHKAEEVQLFPLVLQLADFLAYMCLQEESVDESTLKDALATHLPDFENQWQKHDTPWEETSLELWLNWLRVDREHGSAILDILS